MSKKFIIFFFILCSFKSQSQTQQDSIKATINSMFAAMKNADTTLLKSCFADSAIMQTIVSKNGITKVKTNTLESFVKTVSTLKKNYADEQITFKSIEVDGALANVFTPYNLYLDEKFSHCGANNFVLVRINNKWLIQYIIDTRRKDNCK